MRAYWTGLGLSVLLLGSVAAANDLEILQDTKAYNDMSRQTMIESRRQRDTKWAPPGLNFSLLFAEHTGGEYIHSWLGVPDTGLRQMHSDSVMYEEYVTARRYYQTRNKDDIELRVLVPHPRHIMKVELDLVEDFYELKPPSLKYEAMEEITIQGQSGYIFELPENGICHILLNLAKSSIVNLRGRCTIKKEMLDLANSLSIDRLNKKLES